MDCLARPVCFVSPTGWGPSDAVEKSAACRRGRGRLAVRVSAKKKKKRDRGGAKHQDSVGQDAVAEPTAEEPERAEDSLAKDLARMRQKREEQRAREGGDDPITGTSNKVREVIDTLLVWNFGLIIFFLVWLAVSLVPHFAADNNDLLDPWLKIWPTLIQPVLGVQMLATILSGTAARMSEDK